MAESEEKASEREQHSTAQTALPVFFHSLMSQIRSKSLAEADHVDAELQPPTPAASCTTTNNQLMAAPGPYAILEPGEIPTPFSKQIIPPDPTSKPAEIPTISSLCKSPNLSRGSSSKMDCQEDGKLRNKQEEKVRHSDEGNEELDGHHSAQEDGSDGVRRDEISSCDEPDGNELDSPEEASSSAVAPILISPIDDADSGSISDGQILADDVVQNARMSGTEVGLSAGAFPNLCSQLGLPQMGGEDADICTPESSSELTEEPISIPPLQNIMAHFANQAALFANQAAHFANQVAHYASHAVIENSENGASHPEPTSIPAEFPNLMAHLSESPRVDLQLSALNPVAPFMISPAHNQLVTLSSKTPASNFPNLKSKLKIEKKLRISGCEEGVSKQGDVFGVKKKEKLRNFEASESKLVPETKSSAMSGKLFDSPVSKMAKTCHSQLGLEGDVAGARSESMLNHSLPEDSCPADEPLNLKINKDERLSFPNLINQVEKDSSDVEEETDDKPNSKPKVYYHSGNSSGQPSPGNSTNECPICFKEFKVRRHYFEHMRGHEGKDKFICKDCGKAYASMKRLQIHAKHHRELKPFTCTDCGKGFTMSSNLVNHMRIHTGEKPFVCQICNQGFTQKGNLKRHVLTHKGEQLRCKICSKDFESEDAFTSHMKTHEVVPPQTEFHCQNCEASFATLAQLKQHQLKHTNSSVYQCDVCERVYSDVRTLRTHMWTHGGHKEFSCEQCGKEFTQKANLNSHMRLKHPATLQETNDTEDAQ